MTAKRFIVVGLLGLLVLMFIAVLGVGTLREAPDQNSYAQMADGWLHGRLDVEGPCFDNDCALVDGRTYVVFPPAPGLVALPFVAVFGVHFHYFLPLTILAFALGGFLWWRIASAETGARDLSMLVVLLTLFATPLFFVTLRGDRVWFYAQSWGFLFSTASLYFAMVRRNAWLAGLFISLAFLSRQMTILYLPFLYVILLDPGTRLWRIDGAAVRRALSLAAFPVVAIAIYCAYNYARFGSPLETGYAHIFQLAPFDDPDNLGFIAARARELGIFSRQYLPFNLIYMFIAGPHVEFAGRYLTELRSFDANGASPFLVAPVLLLAVLARWERSFWLGVGTCAVILVVTLFYHSNGYSQYSAQRYALDWLPVLLILVTRGLKPEYTPPLAILTLYAMAVTLGMIVIGGSLAAPAP